MQISELGLDPRLIKAIDHLGFEQATDIQAQAIPVAISGRDLLASSKTGSGKTLAYLLPAMHRMLKTKALSKRDPRAVILAPTRELAKQVFAQLRLVLTPTSLKGCLILGGENFNDQAKALAKDPHVVVATPGRLADHLKQRHLFLNGLELLILDEADRMLDMGFAEELKQIHQAADHRRRQTLMFSATLDHAEMAQYTQSFLREPERVAIGSSQQVHGDIEQSLVLADHLDHKQALLDHFLDNNDIRQGMIFTATREDTQRLAERLNEQGRKAIALSGELNQSARNRIMDEFARGHYQFLVTTDLASRGLDISTVSHVINFDMPKHAEEYVHRIGRTGRAGSKGEALSLIGPKDWQSYLAVQAFVTLPKGFVEFEGLTGKFKGFRPKKAKKTVEKKDKQTPWEKATAKPKRKQARDKRFANSIDVGDKPLLRKKPQADIDTDEPE
ncbi:DEAD/DEAH box helicase [Paraferrimonas sedimenticola]|uniref:RNA helicase n=1 Tax=Paraferrimonas sedimenticola TaxID=375674 RepID=A0AA37RX14_9GAMM|nr:DEAD/DEAH box helicase [Paraferrimonas sedimenticola]GLP96646.1 RNA helicase [Paraferrimonas sedimenticola]